MRTITSGSYKNTVSSDEYIYDLIDKYSSFYGLTKSSFLRLGVELACKRLANKPKEKVYKLVGAR